MSKGARSRAARQADPAFVQRRIDEISAEVRRFERGLAASADSYKPGQAQRWHDHYRRRLERFQAVYASLEHKLPSSARAETELKAGDEICYRGQWYTAIRVNKKTVTVCGWLGVASLDFRVPRNQVTDHRSRTDEERKVLIAAFKKAKAERRGAFA